MTITTYSSLYIPAVNDKVASTTYLPAVSGSASTSCFVYMTAGEIETVYLGYYPSFTASIGGNVRVYEGNNSYVVPATTVNANTWYFAGITVVSGGNLYLYWGPVGTPPTQYSITTSASTSTSNTDIVYTIMASAGIGLASSARYWTTTALTQAQMNAEAASLTPVLTSGLTYHFLSPTSTTPTGLLTDTVGGSVTLTNTSCSISGYFPTKGGSLFLANSSVASSTNILNPISAGGASQSFFCCTSAPTVVNSILSSESTGYYPGMNSLSATQINVFFAGTNGTVTVPTILPNEWYFCAVVGNYAGNVYLYWGPVGSTPTQYTAISVAPAASASDKVRLSTSSSATFTTFTSARYWNTLALTQTQVNQEALSLTPVNTTNLTFEFCNINSTTTAQLLTDHVGGSQTLTGTGVWQSNQPFNVSVAALKRLLFLGMD